MPSLTLASASPDPFEPFSHYTVRDPQGHIHHGYRIDLSTGAVGAYYGIEGMAWTDPPLFANADTVERYGRRYLYVDTGSARPGRRLDRRQRPLLGQQHDLRHLTDRQMFALAESAQPVR